MNLCLLLISHITDIGVFTVDIECVYFYDIVYFFKNSFIFLRVRVRVSLGLGLT